MTYCIAIKAWPCFTDRPRPALPRRAAHHRNSHMLKGRTAVITGSTSGIGLGIARALAGEGANVVLNGFGDAAEIEKTRSAVESEFGIKAAYSPADMTKPAEIAAMVKTAAQTFGSVDILVNHAGIQHVAPIEEFPIEKWDQIIGINLSAAFHAVRAAVPGMKARKWAASSIPHRLTRSSPRHSRSRTSRPSTGWPASPRRSRSSSPRSGSPATASAPATYGRHWSRSRSPTR